MTTLSDLNIVIQQSGGAKAAQKILHTVQEQSQLAAGQQKIREDEQRTTIQSSQDSKRAQLERESPEKESGKRKERRRANRRGIETANKGTVRPRGRGSFVDTVA